MSPDGGVSRPSARHSGRLRAGLRLLAARLRARPDTEHEMMYNRLAISACALTYLAISGWLGYTEASEALAYGLVLCAAYAVLSLLLLAHILYAPGTSHPRRCLALVMDMTVLSLGMHFGDSAFALGYPIYLWIIFGNGFRFGVHYLAASAGAAVIGFALVIATTPVWLRDKDMALGLMVGLIVLPAYVAALIRKLSEAKRQAEEANKAKSMFLASVSHELRTPLNAVITLGDLLADMQKEREARDMAQTIGASGRSLLKLINNILDLSRIEAGRSVQRVNDFDLLALLSQVRRVLSVQTRSKGLDLAFWIGRGLPRRVHGAEQELEEILINLVGNAVKFTEAGVITVSIDARLTAAGATELVVSVSDTGIGIDPDAQSRIFESFVQADASIIDRFGGTGLGLSIVKQLVLRNGGEITVESTPGQGSTFRFTFIVEEAVAGEGDTGSGALKAIVVTRNLSLQPVLAFQGVRSERLAGLEGLPEALRAWSEDEQRPTLIIDMDTLSQRERRRLSEWSSTLLGDCTIGVASAGQLTAESLPRLPVAMAMHCPPTPHEFAMLHAIARVAPAQQVRPVVAEPKQRRRLSILVAEDNATNQKVIRRLLERDGHSVSVVDNGELAVELLTRQDHDLVLMDINMPVMNGLEATKLHRFASLGRPRTPIYALTADVTANTRAACADAGMDGCLHKPIDQDELRGLLDEIAGHGLSVESATSPDQAGTPDADQPIDLAGVPLIDIGTLSNLHELGGRAFVTDLVSQFTSDALRQISELGEAVRGLDGAFFRDVAHSLRSSAANVGARRIFAMCLDWRNASDAELSERGEERVSLLLGTLEATQIEMDAWLATKDEPPARLSA